jgi:response regulator RpfG family c-di-GMP phosphodiesterase
MMSNEKILFVDDEHLVLEALTRQLHKSYAIETAGSATEALEILESKGPFAVIISDLRMPGMDGIALLTEVRKKYPSIIRVILSGDADLEKAIEAVNSGQVFRFLTKPCSTNGLATTLSLALRQYQLVASEKELLNNTLKGSISMLSEVLSLANSRAFSRGYRIRNIVVEIAKKMGLRPLWRYEVAALISQLGCIALPDDILRKVSLNDTLNEGEKKMFADHPRIGAQLVRRIPRLEAVADIIMNQLVPFEDGLPSAGTGENTMVGSHILKVALDYDLLTAQGMAHEEALSQLYGRHGQYNPDILQQLKQLHIRLPREEAKVTLLFDELVPGMIAAEDILAKNGTTIIEKGQEITWPALQGLHNFIEHIGIKEPIKVWTKQEMP